MAGDETDSSAPRLALDSEYDKRMMQESKPGVTAAKPENASAIGRGMSEAVEVALIQA